MGLDVGTKKIGVAVSDPLKLTAHPLTTLQRRGSRADLVTIKRLILEHEVEKIIVGRPAYLSGHPGTTLENVTSLVLLLRSTLEIPVEWADERLSSKEAEQLMVQLGIKGKDKWKRRDAFAAALILQWYLEELRSEN